MNFNITAVKQARCWEPSGDCPEVRKGKVNLKEVVWLSHFQYIFLKKGLHYCYDASPRFRFDLLFFLLHLLSTDFLFVCFLPFCSWWWIYCNNLSAETPQSFLHPHLSPLDCTIQRQEEYVVTLTSLANQRNQNRLVIIIRKKIVDYANKV